MGQLVFLLAFIREQILTYQLGNQEGLSYALSNSYIKKHKISTPLQKSDTALRSYSGHRIEPRGTITFPLEWEDNSHSVLFYIVETQSQSVLSGETCENIGLLKRINSIEQDFPEIFEGLGCLPGTYHIKIDPNATPVVQPPRRVLITMKDKVKEELQRMEKLGVIQRQIEPTEWVNSIVTGTKSSGQVRICIDPKDLNNAIQREHYPMKTVEEIVTEMPNAKIFSTLDATGGFCTPKLDEESSKLTTFQIPFGRYRVHSAPFGIKSTPEIYQRVMTEMIKDIEGACVIVDDILVWGENMEQHDERPKRVLDRVKQNNLNLNFSKCKLRKEEVSYVGHRISTDWLKVDPEKIIINGRLRECHNKIT